MMSAALLRELDIRRTSRTGETEMICSRAAAEIRRLVEALRPFTLVEFPPDVKLEEMPPGEIIGIGVTPEELLAAKRVIQGYTEGSAGK